MRNRKFSFPKIIDQIIVQTDQTTNFADDLSSTYKCNFLGADNKQ